MSGTVLTRGTVVIDVDACKGCDLCIDACPPGVLVDDRRTTVNGRGYRFPAAVRGLHGVRGVLADLPGLRLPGLQVRHPARLGGGGGPVTARLDGGIRGHRRRHDRGGLPVLRRLSR